MQIQKIYAHISCSNLDTSIDWFSKLYGRGPDTRPMAGLAEWHHGDSAGLQLFEDAKHAGSGTLTLGIADLANERMRLEQLGFRPGEIEDTKEFKIVRLRDPDANLVVLVGER